LLAIAGVQLKISCYKINYIIPENISDGVNKYLVARGLENYERHLFAFNVS